MSGAEHGDHVLHEVLSVRDVRRCSRNKCVGGSSTASCTSMRSAVDFGLGRGRAWRDGQWDRRYVETELLRGVVSSSVLLAEADLD